LEVAIEIEEGCIDGGWRWESVLTEVKVSEEREMGLRKARRLE